MPGVPDFYQGTELWDFSLVDPDNRRPVDFVTRGEMLERGGQEAPDWKALVENWQGGEIKLALTRRLLALRARHAELFTDGGYRPLRVSGTDAGRVLAFERHLGRASVVVIVARHFAPATEGGRRWSPAENLDAEIDLSRFIRLTDALGAGAEIPGGRHRVGGLLATLPVAVLEGESAAASVSRKRSGRAGVPV